MTSKLLRFKALLSSIGLVAIAALLNACGGGGASSPAGPAPTPPPLALLPSESVVLYSGVPTTFTIAGGVAPYSVFSSDTGVLTVPASVTAATSGNTTFVVTPRTVTLAEGTSVTITVRDSAGTQVTAVPTVRPNLVSSAVTITPTATSTCASGVCSGGEALVRIVLSLAGQGLSNRGVRFDVLTGDFGFVDPANQTVARSVTSTTDSSGTATGRIRVNTNAPSQVGTFRITEPTGGSFFDFGIQIVQTSVDLNVIPDTVTINGSSTANCSSGAKVDYVVFGGTPPYRFTTTFPNSVRVTPDSVSNAGAAFTVETLGVCFDPQQLIVVDSTNKTKTVVLRNIPGTAAPPPANMLVTPPVLTRLECGQSTTAVINNGSGTFFASSSIPSAVTAVVSGRVVTITRLSPTAAGSPIISPESAVITVGDGLTTQAFSISVPTQCSAAVVPLQTDASTGLTLACSSNQTVTVSGGTGTYSVTPGSIFVNASPVGTSTSLFSFRRLPGGPIQSGSAVTVVVNAIVSDSLRSITIPITTPNTCP